MSNVLETADNVMKEAEIKTTAASMLVRQIEDLKLKLSETVAENKSIIATTPNIAALITKVPESILNENETKTDSEAEPSFEFRVKETEISTVIEQDEVVIIAPIVAKISIPKSTFRNVTDFKGKVNIVTYRKPTLFKNIENEGRGIQEVDSVVVSVSLSENETAKGSPAIRLDLTKKSNGATDNVVCAYWEGKCSILNWLLRSFLTKGNPECSFSEGDKEQCSYGRSNRCADESFKGVDVR